MSQARTLDLGMDVHTDSMAVADVAPEPGAEVTSLGTIGTRQGDLDQLIRRRPSQATQLLFVYAAGPGGDWLYRDLTQQGDDGWVVASSLLPKNPGERVKPDRRDAVQRARLARSGALPAVDVPQGDDEAMRELSRAREDPSRERPAATCRLQAFWRRHASRDTGRANCGGSRTWVVPHRRRQSSCKHRSVPFTNRPHDASVAHTHFQTRSPRGACLRSSQPCRPGAASSAPWP
jgi:transposase